MKEIQQHLRKQFHTPYFRTCCYMASYQPTQQHRIHTSHQPPRHRFRNVPLHRRVFPKDIHKGISDHKAKVMKMSYFPTINNPKHPIDISSWLVSLYKRPLGRKSMFPMCFVVCETFGVFVLSLLVTILRTLRNLCALALKLRNYTISEQ
jgi:hypothetical protein